MVKNTTLLYNQIGFPILFFLFCFVAADLAGQIVRPNVLVIMTDDQGWGDVSYHGTRDIETPNIDALAKSGIILTNFHANSSVCSPSRASLLSGRYPCRVGVPGVIRDFDSGNMGFLHPSATLLSNRLQESGYHTALVGKWHLGIESPNLPNDRGFDHFHGWLTGMMNNYWQHTQRDINYLRLNREEVNGDSIHATDLFTNWANDYLEGGKGHREPFFLYLAYTAPHDPIQPPQEWLDKVLEREKKTDTARARLVALVEHLDWNIGRVIQKLNEQDMLENTVIFFLSDNGGALKYHADNGPYRDGKTSMYQGGLRVPALVNWKGHLEGGKTLTSLLLTMDIFPTILEITGQTIPDDIDSKSFYKDLQNPLNKYELGEWDSRYFARRESFSDAGQVNQAVIMENYKLVQNDPFGPLELYDILADPYEKNNLLENPGDETLKIFNKLRNRLRKHTQACGSVPWQQPH